MALSNRVLNYQDSVNKSVIKLYTSLNDIYTKRGFPIEYKGEMLYAPLVPLDDVYGTPLMASDSNGEYRIAYDTVSTVQQEDLSEYYYKKISGNTTYKTWYGKVSFVVPYPTTININSLLDSAIYHNGVDGDKWQVTYLDIYIDEVMVNRYEFRQSKGESRRVRNIANIDIDLDAGTHTLGLYLTMDCSSKDTQHVYIYQWKNTITLKGD